MLQRTIRAGFSVLYVLADAWFGCKENILCSLDNDLIGIFQMKRGNMTYMLNKKSYAASQLYAKVQRQIKSINSKARYQTASFVVSLNLQTDPKKPDHWVKLRLVFSAPVREHSSDTWVLFLCTDATLKGIKILEVYALRLSIEDYFKEITDAIDQTVESFLKEALQISTEYVAAQLKVEEFGYL